MAAYYVDDNDDADGEHEVHKQGCAALALVVSRKYLGDYTNCQEAVLTAKRIYSQSNGCKACSADCHTTE